MNNAMKWLDTVRGDDSVRTLASQIGSTHATLYRQASAGNLSFEVVRAISRHYGRSVIGDLIATELLTHADAGAENLDVVLQTATDEQLVLEIARRLDVTDIGSIYDKPVSEALTDATIHQLPVRGPEQDEALAASDDAEWQRRQEEDNE